MKCVFEREQMHETLCFSRQSASRNVDARNPMFFSILALVIFLLKYTFKKCFKIVFFSLWRRDPRFWSYNFGTSYVKVASYCGCICHTIVFCSWISEIVLEWLHEGCEMDLLADFLHFGTSVFLLHVGLEQCEVRGVKSAV